MRTTKILQTLVVMMFLTSGISWSQENQKIVPSQKFKTEFEQNIHTLLYISSDGDKIFDPYGHVIETIDTETRKNLFSENGWKEYHAYLNSRQEKLKEDVKLATHSKTESGVIKKGTQKYSSVESGEIIFEADISLSTTSYDVVSLNMGKALDIAVSFVTSNSDNASKVRITGWKVRFVKKGVNK